MSSLPTTRAALHLKQREPRFELHVETKVTIQRRFDRQPRETTGKLLDLAASGAKFSSDIALAIEENVTLFFRFGEQGLNFMVDAQVRWSRPAPESQWWMGCSFTPGLPDEYLESLAGKGLLDRRREVRRVVSLAAAARWELGSSQTLPISIVDISSGGVRMTAPRGAELGQRVLIEAVGAGGKTHLVPTRCQWQVESEDHFAIGCNFLDASGFARLSEAIAISESSAAPLSRRGRRWLWPWA